MRREREDEEGGFPFNHSRTSFAVDEEEEKVDASGGGASAFPLVAPRHAATNTTDATPTRFTFLDLLDQSNVMHPPQQPPSAAPHTAARVQRPRRSLEELREQNRLTVQRFYYRKKVRLTSVL